MGFTDQDLAFTTSLLIHFGFNRYMCRVKGVDGKEFDCCVWARNTEGVASLFKRVMLLSCEQTKVRAFDFGNLVVSDLSLESEH